jgi:hypothetical protein
VALYETTADGKRCPLHDERFKGDDCPRCLAIRAAGAIQISNAVNAVEIDAEILSDINADLAFSRYLHGVSEKRIRDGNPNDWSAAAKLIAEGTKLKYRALEQKDKLSARAHSRYLVEHEKDVRGMQRRKGS